MANETLGGMQRINIGRSGTFTANGTNVVTVTNKLVTPNSGIIITLKTVGGTVGNSQPAIKTITPGTGFTVTALSGDTSVYRYIIID